MVYGEPLPRLPSAPADVARYPEHLAETEGRTLSTVRLRLAAVAAAYRLGGHEDPTPRPLVKTTMKRLAKEHGKPWKQAKGLTKESLAAHVAKATAAAKGRESPTSARSKADAHHDSCCIDPRPSGSG